MRKSKHNIEETLQSFFESSVSKFFTPFDNFIYKQTTAALFLFIATIVALVFANSPWHILTQKIAHIEMGMVFHHWQLMLPIKEWISSGLMALFFFLIGLELKREILAGRLRRPEQISLILMAAVGGMIMPALIYATINYGTAGVHGWAIPMATDTAFAIGVLSLLARKVSYGISVFLIAMAIFDDIGAIAIISVFYSDNIQISALVLSAVTLASLFLVNIAGVRNGWVYAVLGVTLWVFVLHSGIHATLAGLLLAVAVPARTRLGQTRFVEEVRALLSIFEKEQNERSSLGLDARILSTEHQHYLTADIEDTIKDSSTPLQRWETYLVYPIAIIVLPLFALFNAGVSLSMTDIANAFLSPVTQGVFLGLVVGKPFGVCLLVYLGLRLKMGQLPEGMNFAEVIGAGMLAGIGFTMSLFITALSFDHAPHLIDDAKIGILIGSLVSAVAASIWVFVAYRKLESL